MRDEEGPFNSVRKTIKCDYAKKILHGGKMRTKLTSWSHNGLITELWVIYKYII